MPDFGQQSTYLDLPKGCQIFWFLKEGCQLTLGTGGFPGIHMVGWGGGGVGWGMITFFALAHMVGATQHHGMGWGGVGWGMITFLALAHMVGATQHQLSCTCTHGRCYATSWDGVGWGGVGDEVCKERRDSFVLTAGDNCAESLCAVSKN